MTSKQIDAVVNEIIASPELIDLFLALSKEKISKRVFENKDTNGSFYFGIPYTQIDWVTYSDLIPHESDKNLIRGIVEHLDRSTDRSTASKIFIKGSAKDIAKKFAFYLLTEYTLYLLLNNFIKLIIQKQIDAKFKFGPTMLPYITIESVDNRVELDFDSEINALGDISDSNIINSLINFPLTVKIIQNRKRAPDLSITLNNLKSSEIAQHLIIFK